jgi:hypothetical protein
LITLLNSSVNNVCIERAGMTAVQQYGMFAVNVAQSAAQSAASTVLSTSSTALRAGGVVQGDDEYGMLSAMANGVNGYDDDYDDMGTNGAYDDEGIPVFQPSFKGYPPPSWERSGFRDPSRQ